MNIEKGVVYWIKDTPSNVNRLIKQGFEVDDGEENWRGGYIIINWFKRFDDTHFNDNPIERTIASFSGCEWKEYKFNIRSKRKSFKEWCNK